MTDSPMHQERFMHEAIAAARRGIAAGQTPFGACIIRKGRVIATAHNTVWADTDITAHAEIVAIRAACRALGTVELSGCDIYSTCEPCPMCFSAIHWARIDRIVFGARIADAAAAGFHEMPIANERMKALGGSEVEIVGDFLRPQCAALFAEWSAAPGHRAY